MLHWGEESTRGRSRSEAPSPGVNSLQDLLLTAQREPGELGWATPDPVRALDSLPPLEEALAALGPPSAPLALLPPPLPYPREEVEVPEGDSPPLRHRRRG